MFPGIALAPAIGRFRNLAALFKAIVEKRGIKKKPGVPSPKTNRSRL